MLNHIVMWKFKEEPNGPRASETAEKARKMLLALPQVIPEIRHMEVHLDATGNDSNFSAVLITQFDDAAALDRYQNHPRHLETARFIRDAAVQRACVDYQTEE